MRAQDATLADDYVYVCDALTLRSIKHFASFKKKKDIVSGKLRTLSNHTTKAYIFSATGFIVTL